jgi:DNA (cytosine-5)-methyltransferase 1
MNYLMPGEIVVDNFAGGGGASEGMSLGLGTHVDIAINHDDDAIDMHKLNHPETEHYCESVWDVDPVKACKGRKVGVAWFSPDCKHFSKAKGGKPVDKNIRGLAWVAVRWAMQVPVRMLYLENVEEFKTWGPLIKDANGNMKPDPDRKGEIFEAFTGALTDGITPKHPSWREMCLSLEIEHNINAKLKLFKGLGYCLEHKVLSACDYGVPTIRKRFFLVARNDGEQIKWPAPTHSNPKLPSFIGSKLKPWVPAASIIDWSIPVKSIFGRKKPLAKKTMERIAKGIKKFVIDSADPFVVPSQASIPFITEHANGSSQRNMDINEPLRTLCAQVKGGHFALVQPVIEKVSSTIPTFTEWYAKTKDFGGSYDEYVQLYESDELIEPGLNSNSSLVTSSMIKMRGTNIGHGTDEPLHTISAGGFHLGEVRAFLIEYYGAGVAHGCDRPLHTVTTRDRFAIVTIKGIQYQIIDIGMRMLEPHELFAAHNFRSDYIISHHSNGKKLSKKSQVARVGNSVPPTMAQAIVEANIGKETRLCLPHMDAA